MLIFLNTFVCKFELTFKKLMELTGKIIAVLPERSGVSARTGSEWKMASYVLETMEQYPRKMVFEIFGSDRIAQCNVQLGEVLTVSFDIDAREYQGRWFNSIRAWKVDRNTAAPMPQAPIPADIPPFGASPVPPAQPDASSAVPFGSAPAAPDDLPF